MQVSQQTESDKKSIKKSNLINTLKFSVAVSVLAQPFEVLRTSAIMVKNKDIKGINFRGLYMLTQSIYQEEGIKGFFRGSVLSLFRNVGSYAIFFSLLENIQYYQKTMVKSENQVLASSLNFSNAAICRLVSSTAVSPINVLKTRFEIAGQNEYKSIYQSVVQIKKYEGYRGFYRGLASTLMRDMPSSGIQFSIYQNMLSSYKFIQKNFMDQDYYQKKQIPSYVISFCGSMSSMMSLMFVHPFDNIRVRQQCEKKKMQILKLTKQVYLNEGLAGLYKGYLPRLLKKALGGGVVWPLYETIKQSSAIKNH